MRLSCSIFVIPDARIGRHACVQDAMRPDVAARAFSGD